MQHPALDPPPAFASTAAIHGEILQLLEQGDGAPAALAALLQEIERLPDGHPDRATLLGAAHRALAIGQRLEQHRQNEASLRGVFESAQALTELRELDQVLFEIVERGRKLLGSDLAWLAGLDPEDGSLRVQAVSGVFSNETLKTSTHTTTGVAGHVLQSRSPFATSDYMADVHFEHSPGTDLMIRREGLQSLVAAPLLSGAEVVGILIVGDRYARSYLQREISVLATLAAHASVAVRNARAYDLTRQALLKAEQANARLKEQTASLEYAADAHEQLTRLLAKGASLKDLIHAVATILGGQVMYLNAAGIEVCAAAPPGYEAPEVIGTYQGFSGMDSGIQSAVGQSRVTGRATAATVPGTDLHCQVAAVISKDELFGALVVQTRAPMTGQALRILERSAMATAVLQLSTDKSSASLDQDLNLTVRALVEPSQHGDSGLAARIARHGVDITQPTMLALLQVEPGKAGYAVRKLAGRQRGALQVATEIAGQVVVLANHADAAGFEDALRTLLFDELSLPGVACIAGPHTSLPGLAQAYGHLQRALGLLHALRRTDCVVHEASLRMYAVLFQHQSAEALDATIDAVIGRLLKHDARRNAQLTDTLHAYLDHQQNARATAAALQIHANTLHNRLEAIGALLGPWEADGRVADIHLALRLARLRGAPPPSA
ncbi:sugar diacid utilization regulator [Acidovorax sp. CF316]|uniref:helix-turn-helix domain-containing protein n=1 Tax=Acidovorax sp. CF316 TaxID=1144317 RepID=UPI00026BE29A|nr:GAF domain-containing protein [Acidovorax sp. CF316]EJE50488.1 sugar diacid utilization regulator [Acidovorax sp. CF316]